MLRLDPNSRVRALAESWRLSLLSMKRGGILGGFELLQLLHQKSRSNLKVTPKSTHLQIQRLLQFATTHSAHYRKSIGSLEGFDVEKDLSSLPILSKQTLLEKFDQIVTAPRLRRHLLLKALEGNKTDFAGFRVMTTSGTTGARGLFVLSPAEWIETMASYLRAYEMAGRKFRITERTRTAIVGSDQPWHQSTQISKFAQSRWFPTLQLNVLNPEDQIVADLNQFQPQALGGYSGFVRLLAIAQLEGRLKIQPRSVICSAEALSNEVRELCLEAWGIKPFNLYASTECGVMAMECDRHDGLHLFTDRIFVEIVDQDGKAVPPGTLGAKILVTHLKNRTLPLIRYEMSDCLQMRTAPCDCGSPLPLIESIQGRAQDRLSFQLPNQRSQTIHPSVFYALMEKEWVQAWQVRQVSKDRLQVIVAGDKARDKAILGRIELSLKETLGARGLNFVETQVEAVDEIPQGKNGKRQLIIPM